MRSRERLGIDICKLILGSNGDDLDLPRGEMLTKPVVFDSDGLGTRSHLRGVGSSKSKTSGVVFKDSRFDQRLGILFEREESRSHFIDDDTKGKEDTKSLTEANVFGLHGRKSSLGLKFVGPRDRNFAKGDNKTRSRFDRLGIVGIGAKRPA